MVRELHLCFNCLSSGHSATQCRNPGRCRSCGRLHHSLLHEESPAPVTETARNNAVITKDSSSRVLATSMADIRSEHASRFGRLFLDPGSEATLITKKMAKLLRAPLSSRHLDILGVAGGTVKSTYITQVQLQSINYPSEEPVTIQCHIVDELPKVNQGVDLDLHRKVMSDLNFNADCHTGSDGAEVDILLSSEDTNKWMKGDQKTVGEWECLTGSAVVVAKLNTTYLKTKNGWTASGPSLQEVQESSSSHVTLATSDSSEESLDIQLERLWRINSVPEDETQHSPEDQSALDQFKVSCSRLPDGAYRVSLPRKSSPPVLGESRSMALRRFYSNERSLQSRGLLEEFHKAMLEYISLGHAELVPHKDLDKPVSECYYFPVHMVTKISSTTTKYRPVFDASASTMSGSSFNDTLLSGPTLYPLLSTLIHKFRIHKVVFSGDISKMFRCIHLSPAERDYHRFLLRGEDGQIEDCRMTRLTFGVKASPFIATSVLQKAADDMSLKYPLASGIVKSSFYVDDLLTGSDSVDSTYELWKQSTDLCQEAGFLLRKIRSNSPAFLSRIPEDLLENEKTMILPTDSSLHGKCLGIHWDTFRDVFYVSLPTLSVDEVPTKRSVASAAAKVFDIMGWFGPVILTIHAFLQHLWKLKLNWDDPIPQEHLTVWNKWSSNLHLLSDHAIPRPLFLSLSPIIDRQLHLFTDASEKGYGGVVYLRSIHEDTSISVTLLTSKARVSPVRKQTIPKLELSGAREGVRLLKSTARDLNISTEHLFCWTDSMVVLGWLSKPDKPWKQFVTVRVCEILSVVPSLQWRHVSTRDNPADHISRGLMPAEILNCSLWWQGPQWLSLPPVQWPVSTQSICVNLPEEKKVASANSVQISGTTTDLPWKNFSSLHHCVRIYTWVRRFLSNARKCVSDRELSKTLHLSEIEQTHSLFISLAQQESFPEIFSQLKSKESVSQPRRFASLNLFLDETKTVRVGGRLQQSNLPYSSQHPILLHGKSNFTRLLVNQRHKDCHHAGPGTLIAILSTDYYIISLRRLIKSISYQCVTCRRSCSKTLHQLMGHLPSDRVDNSSHFPFQRVGLDFAGPFLIRQGHTRRPVKVKSYICLFVCLHTRAIHLELCLDLTAETFLAALSRFTDRRGLPSSIHSDNGKNLVGAARELTECYALLQSNNFKQAISHLATIQRIEWHFSPARAPHFGGLWEAGVKSMKTLLRKILPEHFLTYEEFVTILTHVEATLNSRPLIRDETATPGDEDILTPGHFIIGRSLLSFPQRPPAGDSPQLLKRWDKIKCLSQLVWQRWRRVYLQTLQARQKWLKSTTNLKVGDCVIIKDDTLKKEDVPSLRIWPLAIIVKTYPGKDGHVRAVDLRCNGHVYNRDLSKLVKLFSPTSDVQSSSSFVGEDVEDQRS